MRRYNTSHHRQNNRGLATFISSLIWGIPAKFLIDASLPMKTFKMKAPTFPALFLPDPGPIIVYACRCSQIHWRTAEEAGWAGQNVQNVYNMQNC